MTTALDVRGLTASLGDLAILKGVDLTVPFGEVHALMGPNGSGKSTLCHVLMGRGGFTVGGAASVGGVDITDLDVDRRSAAGLFEAFQYPVEVPGVTLGDLVDEMAEVSGDPAAFRDRAAEEAERLGVDRFLGRSLNLGLSGGEKKRSEMFQLSIAQPRVAVLDEIDSGLDIDAVREVAALVESMRSPDLGILIITHYSRILGYMRPDRIHVMVGGRIVESGGPELSARLEAEGYGVFTAG